MNTNCIDPKNVQLLGNTCLVRRIEEKETTDSGIFIKPSAHGSPRKVKEAVLISRGKTPELGAESEGRLIFLHGHARPQTTFQHEGQTFDIYYGDDVIAVNGE